MEQIKPASQLREQEKDFLAKLYSDIKIKVADSVNLWEGTLPQSTAIHLAVVVLHTVQEDMIDTFMESEDPDLQDFGIYLRKQIESLRQEKIQSLN